MKIRIKENNTFVVAFGKTPEVGKKYYLVDAEDHTEEQIRTVHALIHCYYDSGCYSDQDIDVWTELKDPLKHRHGPKGRKFDFISYFDPEKLIAGVQVVDKWSKVPKYIKEHPQKNKIIKGHLRSFANYTKKELSDFINSLICEMETVGVNTPKYREIRRGMESNNEQTELDRF